MKTLKITLALITSFAISYSQAQTTSIADSSIDMEVSVVYNSNMTTQVPTTQSILFEVDTLNNSSIIAVGNTTINSTYAFDPAICVFPFTLDTIGVPSRAVDLEPALDRFYSLDFGFTSSLPATISVTAAFSSATNGTYCAFLKCLSTGQVYPILNDTVTLNIPVNTNYNTDFILLVGPAVVTTGINEACYGDGQGGVEVICQSAAWDYKIYNNSNNLIRQHNSFTNDTTVNHLPQGNYTIKTFIDHVQLDSSSFTVNGPAPIVPVFTVSNYSPSENEAVNFTNGSFGATSYSWDFGDTNTDTLASTSHAYAVAGTYTITLTAINGACSAIITDSVQVIPLPLINPNQYNQSPGNRPDPNLNSTQREENNQEINVATDMHKITVSSGNELRAMTIEILNVNGQLISSSKSNSAAFETSVENAGIYLVRVSFENGEVVTRRIAVL